MPKVSEYAIASGMSEAEFEEEVNTFLREGWQPLGSIAVTTLNVRDEDVPHYAQAMVR